MPKFSIIIPTYNSQETLNKSLESILNQTFKDLEIIIIDGCSNDTTVEIIKSFAVANSNIKWLSEKDSGIYDAMNKGIKMASGEWLYFLGSDDYLINNDVFFKVAFNISILKEEYNFIYGNIFSDVLGEKYDGEFSLSKLLSRNIGHQAIFYHKSVFSILGKYNLKYKIWSDYEFNLRCFLSKKIKPKYIDITIAVYTSNGKSSLNEDELFKKEYFNIIKQFGYKTLSLRQLKSYCYSNFEFALLLIKRIFTIYLN